jgi:hypothetical protein
LSIWGGFDRIFVPRGYFIASNLITANPITAEKTAIPKPMNTIENQNLCDDFHLGLRRSVILLELFVLVERDGGFRLIARTLLASMTFCCWSCSIRRWLCRISASNLATERARLICLGLVEATFFAGGCGSCTHPIPNLDDENNSNAVSRKSRFHKSLDRRITIDREV